MRKILIATSFLSLALSIALGQAPPKAAAQGNPTAKAPETKPTTIISQEKTITYLWGLVDTLELQIQVDTDTNKWNTAKQKLNGITTDLQNTCGKDKSLTLGKNRELICESETKK